MTAGMSRHQTATPEHLSGDGAVVIEEVRRRVRDENPG